MILDNDLQFSKIDTAAIGNVGTAYSANIVDLTKAGDAVAGAELYLVVKVHATITSASTTITLQVGLQTDSAAAFNVAAVMLFLTPAIAKAGLVANSILVKMKLPPGLKQFNRIAYIVAGENSTGGSVDAFLTPDANIA